MILTFGIRPDDRATVARLYWQAFGGKLGHILGPASKAEAFIASALGPDHAICAHDANGRLVGVAGFKTARGALVDGSFSAMARIYGRGGALWRMGLMALLQGDVDNERFLIDGIVVERDMRGQGVGSALIAALRQEAMVRGYRELRLEVVDTNPRARALYERQGFNVLSTKALGPLRYLFGFRAAISMVRSLH